MSVELLKNPEYYEQACIDYLDGVVLGDFVQVKSASIVMASSSKPFSKWVHYFGYIYEQKILEDALSYEDIEQVAKAGLRAYCYSGLEVNKNIVWMVTDFLQKDKDWLQGVLAPTHSVMTDMIWNIPAPLSTEQKNQLGNLGYKALRKLGVNPVRNLIAQVLFYKG